MTVRSAIQEIASEQRCRYPNNFVFVSMKSRSCDGARDCSEGAQAQPESGVRCACGHAGGLHAGRSEGPRASEADWAMKPRYMLDTNICIYIAKHQPPEVKARFERLKPGRRILGY